MSRAICTRCQQAGATPAAIRHLSFCVATGWQPVAVADTTPHLTKAQLDDLRASALEIEAHAGEDLSSALEADDACCEPIACVGLCGIERAQHTAAEVARHLGYHVHEFIGVNAPGSVVRAI